MSPQVSDINIAAQSRVRYLRVQPLARSTLLTCSAAAKECYKQNNHMGSHPHMLTCSSGQEQLDRYVI